MKVFPHNTDTHIRMLVKFGLSVINKLNITQPALIVTYSYAEIMTDAKTLLFQHFYYRLLLQ